ncbi:MAG: glycosyltransferase family 39 protein [Phycisphaerae bacterium]
MLVLILLVAAGLRLVDQPGTPPGMNHDAAANAWNAWCLLKTGTDQEGCAWPIFYFRAHGENRSTLFLYLLLPFEAIGGLSVYTSRLPAIVGGLATVLLVYWVARWLFDQPTALAAAGLLAINPTHIQMSRWGHEASVAPLLTLLPLAALLWAGLPPTQGQVRPRPGRALLAGLLAGVCCYGYPAVRLFLPPLAVAIVLVDVRGWWRLLNDWRGRLAVAGLALGLLVTFTPLAWQHVVDHEHIGKRAATTWIWQADDPPATKATRVLERYAEHFSPKFLLRAGDADEVLWTTGFGFLPWYCVPLLAAGLVVVVPRLRDSVAARLIPAGIVLFPVGDMLNRHISMHGLRSSAGLIFLILPAAVGVGQGLAYLATRRKRAALVAATVALVALIVPETARFLHAYFVERPPRSAVYNGTQVDVLEACRYLKPRFDDVDAVVCTAYDTNQPYLLMLVSLGYDPQRWFAEPREIERGLWDRYLRVGKMYFTFADERDALIARWRENGRPDRVFLILNPDEPAPGPAVHRIIRPDGSTARVLYDVTL